MKDEQTNGILAMEHPRTKRKAPLRPKAEPAGTPSSTARPATAAKPVHSPCAILVREDARTMRMIECEFDGLPSFMLRLLRACYRTRDEALALVRAGDMVSIDFCLDFCEPREAADGSVGTSRAVPYRTDAVLAAAAGCGHVYVFDDETRLWHVWTSDGWRVDEDPSAPDLADIVEHLRARSEGIGDADGLPF